MRFFCQIYAIFLLLFEKAKHLSSVTGLFFIFKKRKEKFLYRLEIHYKYLNFMLIE